MILRRLVPALTLLAFAPVALGLGACGGTTGQNAASQVLKTPELPDDAEAKCRVRKSQSEPLIVEWPNGARGRLESTTRRGLIPIKYEGCELTQLTSCTVKSSVGAYAYWPITRKQSKVVIKDSDELFANMPVGALKLEGKLKSAGQLDVNMTIIGRYEAPTHTVFRNDLEGADCDKATHVIAAMTVGSFTFTAGADAEVGGGATVGAAGAGGKSTAKRETLQSDGDEAACARASANDKGPPEGCGALLQIEVVNLTKGSRPPPPPVVAPVPPPVEPTPPAVASNTTPSKPVKPPKCKKGEKVEDGVCVKVGKKSKPVIIGAIGTGTGAGGLGVGGGGIGSIAPLPTCAAGQHLEKGRCVEDLPPEPAPPPPPPPPKECASGMRLEGDECVAGERQVAEEEARPKATPTVYDQTPVEQRAPNPLRTLFGYSAIGFGLVFSTAGYIALGSLGAANDGCKGGTCTAEGKDKQGQAMTAAIVADVALGLTLASLIGFFLVPATVKVGVAPTPNGGVASAAWRFQ
ncbi:MAG: hypothetical protein KIT84_20365 [Labilithrix sp.]|nr:hypothetical protein [Labilithrix sp.]MCW5813394.1 hypothetical protein [Labilithrix sp.]